MDMPVQDRASALKAPCAARYDNYIGGQWVAPKAGRYFENISPVTGRVRVWKSRSGGLGMSRFNVVFCG